MHLKDIPPADLSIPEAASQLRAGNLTSVALTQACLDRIAARDPLLHAFTAIDETALGQAATADQAFANGQDLGPLQGIPVGIKDLIDVAGLPATCGSAVFAERRPAVDAAIITRLRARRLFRLPYFDRLLRVQRGEKCDEGRDAEEIFREGE